MMSNNNTQGWNDRVETLRQLRLKLRGTISMSEDAAILEGMLAMTVYESRKQGSVVLLIDDVRKLLGGFGTSQKEMDHPFMAVLYKDHPEALKRVAEAIHLAMESDSRTPDTKVE